MKGVFRTHTNILGAASNKNNPRADSHGGLTKEIKFDFIKNQHVANIFCKADMGNLVSISLFLF